MRHKRFRNDVKPNATDEARLYAIFQSQRKMQQTELRAKLEALLAAEQAGSDPLTAEESLDAKLAKGLKAIVPRFAKLSKLYGYYEIWVNTAGFSEAGFKSAAEFTQALQAYGFKTNYGTPWMSGHREALIGKEGHFVERDYNKRAVCLIINQMIVYHRKLRAATSDDATPTRVVAVKKHRAARRSAPMQPQNETASAALASRMVEPTDVPATCTGSSVFNNLQLLSDDAIEELEALLSPRP